MMFYFNDFILLNYYFENANTIKYNSFIYDITFYNIFIYNIFIYNIFIYNIFHYFILFSDLNKFNFFFSNSIFNKNFFLNNIYHYSIPTNKLFYPEPFIASPSFFVSDLWYLHILLYWYWLWFIFIFIIVFFFLIFIVTVRWNLLRNKPKKETRGLSRSKCGDLITATVPVTWAASIIVSESIDSIDYYDGFNTNHLIIGIRAYQWGWEYYYPKDTILSYSSMKPNNLSIGKKIKYNSYSNQTFLFLNFINFHDNYFLNHKPSFILFTNLPKILIYNINNTQLNLSKTDIFFKNINYFKKNYFINSLQFSSIQYLKLNFYNCNYSYNFNILNSFNSKLLLKYNFLTIKNFNSNFSTIYDLNNFKFFNKIKVKNYYNFNYHNLLLTSFPLFFSNKINKFFTYKLETNLIYKNKYENINTLFNNNNNTFLTNYIIYNNIIYNNITNNNYFNHYNFNSTQLNEPINLISSERFLNNNFFNKKLNIINNYNMIIKYSSYFNIITQTPLILFSFDLIFTNSFFNKFLSIKISKYICLNEAIDELLYFNNSYYNFFSLYYSHKIFSTNLTFNYLNQFVLLKTWFSNNIINTLYYNNTNFNINKYINNLTEINVYFYSFFIWYDLFLKNISNAFFYYKSDKFNFNDLILVSFFSKNNWNFNILFNNFSNFYNQVVSTKTIFNYTSIFNNFNNFNINDGYNNNFYKINQIQSALELTSDYKSLQKVFKNQFDDSKSFISLNFLTNIRYFQLNLTNNIINYTKNIYKNNNYINTIQMYSLSPLNYSLLNNTLFLFNNIYIFQIPFLISKTSENSKYLWLDWFSRWLKIESQQISLSKFGLYGMPKFSKNLNFNWNSKINTAENENYIARLYLYRKFYINIYNFNKKIILKTKPVLNVNYLNLISLTNNFSLIKVFKKLYIYNFINSNECTFNNSLSSVIYFNKVSFINYSTYNMYSNNYELLTNILLKQEVLYQFINQYQNNNLSNLNSYFLKNKLFYVSFFKNLFNNFESINLKQKNLLQINFIKSYLYFFNFNKNIYNCLLYFKYSKLNYIPIKKNILNMLRLQTSNVISLPIELRIQLLASSKDIIHSWAIPAAGIKIDCIPGYSSHKIIFFLLSGIYWGQCMEICGRYHHWMPIIIYFMKKDIFFLWCNHFILINLNHSTDINFTKNSIIENPIVWFKI